MSEWWTYRLSDFLLFSPRTYYRLFELYNQAIWPAQILAVAIGVAVAAMLWKPGRWNARLAAVLLGACWLWVAWAYLFVRYASINWAASYFAAAFAVEALLLVLFGVVGSGFSPRKHGRATRIGIGLVLFALAIQPVLGPLLGRSWSQVEIFGVTPDPTVVATLGALVATSTPWRWLLLPIPLAWCALSGATQWTMGSADAWLMPLAAAVAVAAIFVDRRRRPAMGRGRARNEAPPMGR